MAGQIPANSVWSAMGYAPPRGPCNHKSSLMSPACACNRFMLHPVKAATSFECDGCNHHASFHSLENVAEDAVLKKWAAEETKSSKDAQAGAKKRKLITQASADDQILPAIEFGQLSRSESVAERMPERSVPEVARRRRGIVRAKVVDLSKDGC